MDQFSLKITGRSPEQVPFNNVHTVARKSRSSERASRESHLILDTSDTYVISRCKSPVVTRQSLGIGERDHLSNWQACANLIKASVGTGGLAMPAAIRNAGLLLGTVSVFVIAMIIVHAMDLLVRCAQFLRAHYQFDDDENLDYTETVRKVMTFGFPNHPRLTWLASYTVFCLICTQMGALGVYMIFLAENTQYMVNFFDVPNKPPLIVYQAIVLALVLPLVFIKTLRKMAFISGIGNLLSMLALSLMLIYCMLNLQPVTNFDLVKEMDTIPLFFGVVVFAFESIAIILHIENKMIEKDAFPGFSGALNLSMVTTVCMYLAVGFYGYLCFGDEVAGSITYSIPMSPWYFMIAKPMYAVTIYLNYILQFYVLFAIIWDYLSPFLYTSRALFWGDTLLRISLVLISFILSIVVPHVDLMISLMGAFTGSSLTLILPPIIHSVIVWKEKEPFAILTVTKNIGIIVIGVLGALIGTYTSIIAIIAAF